MREDNGFGTHKNAKSEVFELVVEAVVAALFLEGIEVQNAFYQKINQNQNDSEKQM